ncbi:pyridoxal phosphate-dependent aminotransferase [Teredinibacter turnerae]|uniref:alanine transaminase n=1 Tax=Teredinibacter turnerae (strain ATCC 39867 / T7901) TaxID=377629 RepID=C5BR53_TERTT|nr:pyridoxal phosphate-dependent aminotransferase [Teredinibacter turnerae]ACR10819.1 putative aspartate aminotransferase [Teredinibacter turnerae T7901]
MQQVNKSRKLDGVCYDIRGPVLEHSVRLEEEGHKVIKLNIGNPAPFGFDAPDEIIADVIHNIRNAQGYTESRGLFPARKAIMQECQRLNVPDVDVDDIFLGNGVSELIMIATQALLNDGDEVLVPSPDYPLWTAAVNLAGGKAVHYMCDEESDWFPDIDDIRSKVSSRTRAIVLINPNNPTGAVYSKDLLEQLAAVAREHNLVVFADEIYSKIIYDDAQFTSMGSIATDVVCVTFNGLSKSYRLAGFRSGWLVVSGAKRRAPGFVKGIEMLASMRLCANAPAMYAVQTALGGYQSINELILPGGRLREQRDLAWQLLTEIPGISCVKPKGAIYLFPKIDRNVYKYEDDQQLILDLLLDKKILLVQGTAFNLTEPDHFRIVFLPQKDDLRRAIERFGSFIQNYR